MTIIQTLFTHVTKYPDKLAVISDDGAITYKELGYLVRSFSEYLYNNGLNKGDTVVIQGMQNTAFVVAILGTLLSGGIVVPIDKGIKNSSLNTIVNAVNSKFIFANGYIKEFSLSYLKHLLKDIVVSSGIVFPDADDVSDILFTTGTTGTSEGIIHTNKSHYATVENILGLIEMPDNNVSLMTAPLNHAFALRRFYANIVHGSTIVLIDNILPLDNFFNVLDKYSITSIAMNPSALAIILKMSKDRLKNYKNILSYIEFSSSPLQQDILKEVISLLPDTKMYNIYGSTEAGCMTGFDNAKYIDKTGSIGQANIHSSLFILDDNYKEIQGYGKENQGILAIKSDIVMKNYLNSDEKSNSVLKNGMYLTNDIVYKDQDNFYYFIGRKSDVISIGGLKASPIEIENIAREYKGIIDCACIGKEDKIAGQVPVLFIEIDENIYNSDGIYKHLSTHLEAYKCPKNIIVVDKLPKTFNGKIIRRELKKLL